MKAYRVVENEAGKSRTEIEPAASGQPVKIEIHLDHGLLLAVTVDKDAAGRERLFIMSPNMPLEIDNKYSNVVIIGSMA